MGKSEVMEHYCAASTASIMLRTSERHISLLVSSGQLKSNGQGSPLHVSITSIHALKRANPDGILPEPRGYIYLIYWHGYYKIGQATDPQQRIREIVSSHPVRPDVIHLIPTDFMNRLENHLHSVFADKRVSGEWFHLSDEDVQRIKAIESYLMDYKTRMYGKLPI